MHFNRGRSKAAINIFSALSYRNNDMYNKRNQASSCFELDHLSVPVIKRSGAQHILDEVCRYRSPMSTGAQRVRTPRRQI